MPPDPVAYQLCWYVVVKFVYRCWGRLAGHGFVQLPIWRNIGLWFSVPLITGFWSIDFSGSADSRAEQSRGRLGLTGKHIFWTFVIRGYSKVDIALEYDHTVSVINCRLVETSFMLILWLQIIFLFFPERSLISCLFFFLLLQPNQRQLAVLFLMNHCV